MPGAHLVTTNYEILGGPATALVVTANSKFRDANPKTFKAFCDALNEAIDVINRDKRAAARAYLELANDKKSTLDEINGIISDKDYHYTLRPQKVLATAQFMAHIGSIKKSPAKLEDLFFLESGGLKGD